eukprot:m.146656 g.146656  ORF g.146656 m.146656 type:complete len:488 (-) comp14154_c1_seq1:51-1514(-)
MWLRPVRRILLSKSNSPEMSTSKQAISPLLRCRAVPAIREWCVRPLRHDIPTDHNFFVLRLFFGPEGQRRIREAFVVVVGLGGVGSHAAHMLARAGVGRLRLIDFDNVTLSSLNRHAVATRADVGRPKVRVCATHFAGIAPFCAVEALDVMFEAAATERLLDGQPLFVVDAIDDVKTKADLLEGCTARGIPVISALGAGSKVDPTRIIIGDLMDTVNDPLALKLRWELRTRWEKQRTADGGKPEWGKKKKIEPEGFDVRVVSSYEKVRAGLAALDEDQLEEPDAFGALPNMRLRVLPVLGTQPAVFGMSCAAHVLTHLAGAPLGARAMEPVSRTFASKLCDRLRMQERKLHGNEPLKEGYVPVADVTEVLHLIEEVWGCKSAFSGLRMESRKVFELTRFDRSKPALPYNLIFVTREEAAAHNAATAATGSLPAALLDPSFAPPPSQDAAAAAEGVESESAVAPHSPATSTLRRVHRVLAEMEAGWPK